MFYKALLVASIILFCSDKSFGQNIIVRAKADTNAIKIGEQFQLELMAKGPVGSKFVFPNLTDTINSHFEIISKGKNDTLLNDEKTEITLKQKWTITSFDSGYWAIEPLKFYNLPDTSKYYETEAFLMQVNTVSVDTTKEIKDIKTPFSAPISWQEWLPYALGGAGILILILVIIWILKKNKTKPVEIPEIIVSPGEKAISLLIELDKKRLWQNNYIKEYYTELTDILRNYFDEKYLTQTNEQVSHEILISMRTHINQLNLEQLRQILWLADMVKFAKEQPLAGENEMAFKNAYEIVSVTSVLIERNLND